MKNIATAAGDMISGFFACSRCMGDIERTPLLIDLRLTDTRFQPISRHARHAPKNRLNREQKNSDQTRTMFATVWDIERNTDEGGQTE
jgi:hypothetical protein